VYQNLCCGRWRLGPELAQIRRRLGGDRVRHRQRVRLAPGPAPESASNATAAKA